MIGVSRTDGTALEGVAHIAQSIADILTTPIGTRVMRRDYGSLVPELIDAPMTRATLLRVYGAVVLALGRWEPRVRVEAITGAEDAAAGAGRLTLRLDVTLLESGERSNVEVVL